MKCHEVTSKQLSYTVEEVITVLTQEYEGVASSDMIFKDFYQLRQERNEKVQIFSIRLQDMLIKLSYLLKI